MEDERPRHLCSICRGILRPAVPTTPTDSIQPSGQTFDVFRDAVDKRCVICLAIWELSSGYRHLWTQSPQRWKGLHYRAYKDDDAASIINLLIVYPRPWTDHIIETEFRLIPINDSEFQDQLQLPRLEAQVAPETVLKLGQSWLTDCLRLHPGCCQRKPLAQNWHPTRLIDVGAPDSTDWKVCVVAEDGVSPPCAEYLTLSYRWAPNPKILLTSSNLDELRHGRPVSTLPLLFQHVVAVAWHFSFRYVWIDALCILQDSQGDWEAEAPTMWQVYSNSSCNIAASASQSPDQGLFHARDLEMILPGLAESSLLSSQPAVYLILDESYWDRQMLNGPLQNRGWVFQERFLAPRVLYFAKHQLLWECFTKHQCEVFPRGIPTHWSSKTRGPLLDNSSQGSSTVTAVTSYDALRLWTDLVLQYSHCQLSKPSDKLIAIAGIAKLFQETTGDEYLAGMWKSRLPAMMDWRVHSPQPHQCLEYRAPSWSWASVGGLVRPYGISSDAEVLVELVSAKVATRTPDPMSAVEGGSITLQGRVVPIVCRVVGDFLTTFEFVDRTPAEPLFSVQVFPDVSDMAVEPGRIVSYMPLKLDYYADGSEGRKRPQIFCLLLDQISRKPNSQGRQVHRRIGYFVFYNRDKDDSSFSGPLSVFDIA